MKRSILLALLIVFFMTFNAMAIEWTVANQSTIAWDAVTKTSEGKDFQTGDVIKYQVYIVNQGAAKDTGVKIGAEVTALEYTITFPTEGVWLSGVKSIRIPGSSKTNIQESTITWSDNTDTTLVPVPFGFIYFAPPARVGGLGPK